MNRLSLIAATALAASGCVNDSPLFVTGIFPMDDKCSSQHADSRLGSGFLDISGAGSYLMIIDIKNDLDPSIDTKADTSTLVSGIHRNTINIDSFAVTFTTVPASIVLEPEVVPVTVVMAPGDTIQFGTSLFGPKATQKIFDSLPNNNDRLDVRAKFEFRGNIISGGRVTSTPLSFPVSIVRSGFACAAGATPVRSSTCGRIGGQDNDPICCSDDMNCKPK